MLHDNENLKLFGEKQINYYRLVVNKNLGPFK